MQQVNSVKEVSKDDRKKDVLRFMTRWDEWHGSPTK